VTIRRVVGGAARTIKGWPPPVNRPVQRWGQPCSP